MTSNLKFDTTVIVLDGLEPNIWIMPELVMGALMAWPARLPKRNDSEWQILQVTRYNIIITHRNLGSKFVTLKLYTSFLHAQEQNVA
jgi:hypothetical protein